MGKDSEYYCYAPELKEALYGTTLAWVAIDVVIYFAFLITMLILIMKFIFGQKIGMDFGKMFGVRYMRFMVEKILKTLIDECNAKFPLQFY